MASEYSGISGLIDEQNTQIKRNQERLGSLEDSVASISEKVDNLAITLAVLEKQSTVLYNRSSYQRATVLPTVFGLVALMFGCIVIASPVLISSIRTQIFGDNPAVWYAYLIGLLTLFLALAFVTLIIGQYRRLL